MEKILIIEDSQVAQAQLADILAEAYSLDFQHDGPPGIAAAAANPPDIILLDVHLPTLNGYEICTQLKTDENTREIPIIFITSMNSESQKVKGFEAGAVDYIVKPFYPQELVARVKTHLAAQRLAKQSLELEKLKLFKEMAVAVSHEINNPLTSVYGFLYMLEKHLPVSDEQVSASLKHVRNEVDRIRDIVATLATTSRIVQTKYMLNEQMIDLKKS